MQHLLMQLREIVDAMHVRQQQCACERRRRQRPGFDQGISCCCNRSSIAKGVTAD